jgi:hypothetical protein
MKRKPKKLVLAKETLLHLDWRQIRGLGEPYWTAYPCTTECPTGYWVTCGPTTRGAACDTTPCEIELT